MSLIVRLAYERRLLDSAGGNLTVREGDRVYMSPRYAGSKQQWQLEPEDFLVVELDGTLLAGNGEISRESAVHLGVYRAYPKVGCVFHAHPLNVMVYVSAVAPLPPASEQTDKFGELDYCEWAPAHSPQLGENVVAGLRPLVEQLDDHPVATLVPRHGIFLAAKTLDSAYDTLERVDRAAYINLMGRLLPGRQG
jgi:L-fuculose-phosphate aldolase